MLVFASPRGSQNDQKCIQKWLLILLPFQLQKNTLPASILVPLGSLLGPPRRPQGASKTSLKPLLEASWAILAANSLFGPPWGYPWAQFLAFFDHFWSCFCSKKCFDSFYKRLFCTNTCFCNCFGFSASQRHNRVPWTAPLSFFLNQLLVKPPIAAAVWAKPLWIFLMICPLIAGLWVDL